MVKDLIVVHCADTYAHMDIGAAEINRWHLDRGWDAILAKLHKDSGGAHVKVGIQQDSVREPDAGKAPADMVQIAAVHEFGATKAGKNRNVTIPERSFIRAWHDAAAPQIQKLIQRLVLQYIDGKITMDRLLAKLGNFAQGGMRKYLRDLKEPALAESTVKGRKKGTRGKNKGVSSDNPLVDTGQLLAFIHYIAVKRGVEVGRTGP